MIMANMIPKPFGLVTGVIGSMTNVLTIASMAAAVEHTRMKGVLIVM
jgi:hypothetical protein